LDEIEDILLEDKQE